MSAVRQLHTSFENEELIEHIAATQDREAFRTLFNNYAGRIKAFALKSPGTSGSGAVADEIVQETLLKIWRNAGQFNRSKASADAWVFTIARNARIDMQRRNKHYANQLDIDDVYYEPESPGPVADLRQNQIQKNISEGLDQLSEEQALVLRKMYMEGKSQSEIAEEFGIPLGTIKSRTRLALSRMRLIMKEKDL